MAPRSPGCRPEGEANSLSPKERVRQGGGAVTSLIIAETVAVIIVIVVVIDRLTFTEHCCKPDTVLSAFHVLTHLILSKV